MMYRIVATTDGKFIGQMVESLTDVLLDGEVFHADKNLQILSDSSVRLSNSNYSIDLEAVEHG